MKTFKVCIVVMSFLTMSACSHAPYGEENNESRKEEVSIEQNISGEDTGMTQNTSGEDIVITMAVHNSPSTALQAAIKAFNDEDNGYQIRIENYHQYYDDSLDTGGGEHPEGYIKADFELQMDIMQGGVVDIVPDVAFMYTGRFDILEQKGAFIDLNPFLEQDSEVNRTTMNAHILDISKKDGKLYSLPIMYTIETMVGPEPYVGIKENWTVDEMIARWNQMPDNAIFSFGSMDKNHVFMYVLRENIGRYVDYENVCCYFDSPDFVKILEFCNTFPPMGDTKQDAPEGSVTFATDVSFENFDTFHRFITGKDGTPWTIVGYPSEDGRGSFIDTTGERYGICYKSSPEVQEGAWQFLRTLTGEDYLRSESEANYNVEFYGFPVNNDFFEKLGQEEMRRDPDPDEELIHGANGRLTQEEYDRLVKYIDSIPYVNNSLDNELEDIIYDELQIMFEGRQTPQQTADAIQSRASLYVSEKAG